MFGLFGTTAMWIGLAVLLVATVFVRNLYCRFLCPVGALLGLISNLTVFRIKRWSECNTCKICEKTCEWGAIQGPKIIKSECVRCDDCERLYMDQKKCPHWIIICGERFTARPSAAPTASAGSCNRDETSTSFVALTITPRRLAVRSISAIPSSGPSMNTPCRQPVGDDGAFGTRS